MFKPPKRSLRSTKASRGGEPESDEPFPTDDTRSQLKDSIKSKLFKPPKRQTCVESKTESESANKLSKLSINCVKNQTRSGQEVMHKEGCEDSQLQNDEHNVTLRSAPRKRGRPRANQLNENNKCVAGGNKVKLFVAPKRLRREVVAGTVAESTTQPTVTTCEEQTCRGQQCVNTAGIGDRINNNNVTDNEKNSMLQTSGTDEKIGSVIRSSKRQLSKSDEGCRDGGVTEASEPPTPSISSTSTAFSTVAVYTPAGQKYMINNTQKDRPSHFKASRDEFQWDGSVLANVRRLKYDLKSGDFCPTTLDLSVEKEHKDLLNAVRIVGAKCYEQETDTRKMLLMKFFELENQLLHFNKLVLTDLAGSFNEVLKKLVMLFSLNLHPVMLKKNPEVVQTVQKLAAQNRYPKLKHVATKFLDRIKMILAIQKDENFEERFARMLNAFEQSTAHLTPAEKYFVPGFPDRNWGRTRPA